MVAIAIVIKEDVLISMFCHPSIFGGIHLGEIFCTFKRGFKMKCTRESDMATALAMLRIGYLQLLSILKRLP